MDIIKKPQPFYCFLIAPFDKLWVSGDHKPLMVSLSNDSGNQDSVEPLEP